MGALHTWAAVNSYSMNADGISYLDIGDAYFTGDWENAINPVWSPMYSWVLGLALYVFKPPMAMEFRLVHLVNYSIYLTALASFLFFWKQVLSYQQLKHGTSAESVMLPAWAMYSIGILLFIWASLTLIEIWAVTPDMLMAAIIFLAAALLLRMRMSELNLYQHALFGFLLGVGFLTKTVMLPISFLFLIFSLLPPRRYTEKITEDPTFVDRVSSGCRAFYRLDLSCQRQLYIWRKRKYHLYSSC
jgi:4-amino-4-deoxy-L-arabinose transferase-like glycosyltransferase